MRAIFLNNFDTSETMLEGDKFHHLVNVVRAKIGDEILILNGKGQTYNATIISINKKVAHLEINSSKEHIRNNNLTLALCLPKRDALDLCIKQAVEIGIKKIYLISSDYSVNKSIKLDRIERIVESAIEQSNNPFMLELELKESLSQLRLDNYDQVYCLNSQTKSSDHIQANVENSLLIVGPEGGFSDEELNYIDQNKLIKNIHLNTHIMRTPTALVFGSALILSKNCIY